MPFPARPRITSLITLGVCSTVLVTVLAVMLLVDHFAVNYAAKMAEQRLQQLSWQMRDALNLVLEKAVGDVRLVSQLTQVRASTDPAETRSVLNELQKNFPDYAWIGLTNNDGTVFASTRAVLEGVNVSARPWFQMGKNQLAAGDYHPALLLSSKLPQSPDPWRFVDVSVPVLHPDGSPRGVMGVHLSWEWARELAKNLLAPSDQQYAVDILVVRRDNTVLLGPPDLSEQKISNASLSAAQAGGSGALTERWADGVRYITGYAETGHANDPSTLVWSVLVRQPEAQVLAAARQLEHGILLVGALLALALAIAAAALARHLAQPLNTLIKVLESRARQQKDGVPPLPIPIIDTFHEAQLLSHTLFDMVEREERHLLAVHAINEQLELTVQARTHEIAHKANALEHALTRQQRTQLLLQQSTDELKAVLDHAPDAFIALDAAGVVIEWNDQAEKLLGWRRAEIVGVTLGQTGLPATLQRAYEEALTLFRHDASVLHHRIEIEIARRDGRVFPVEASMAHVPRDGGDWFIVFLQDISVRQNLITSLEAMALCDPLTQLMNRRALMPALEAAMLRARRLQRPLALCFIDLDGFKQINDVHGHDGGDELLRQLAQRIVATVRKSDTVARLGGDEFVVILEMLHQPDDARDTAEKLLLALRQPFLLDTASVTLSASIGIALHHPHEPNHADQLLSRADKAMYQAKSAGKDRSQLV